jgi:hypothetical protein
LRICSAAVDLKCALTYEIAYKKLKSFESFTLEWTRKGTEFLFVKRNFLLKGLFTSPPRKKVSGV